MLPSPSEFTQDTGLNCIQFYWLNEIYFFFPKRFPLFLVKIVTLTSLHFSAPKSLWKEATVISLADSVQTHYLVKQAFLPPDITSTKASDSPLSQILQFALYLDTPPYYTNKTEPVGGKCWWGRNPLASVRWTSPSCGQKNAGLFLSLLHSKLGRTQYTPRILSSVSDQIIHMSLWINQALCKKVLEKEDFNTFFGSLET